VFLHLTRFPVTATRIFLTLNVVFARAPQRFHAGRFIYIYGKKKIGEIAENFFTVYDKTQLERTLRGVKKKKKEKENTFFKIVP